MDDFVESKTLYTIVNEHGEKTTITLDKWIADVLQFALGAEVHTRIQAAYDKVLAKYPDLSRKQRGDLVRQMAFIRAQEDPEIERKFRGFCSRDLVENL